MLSSWPAVRSCVCDQKLTVTSQQTFIDGSNSGRALTSLNVMMFRIQL
jgi:hypothetical protein